MTNAFRGTTHIALRDLRIAGALMLAAGVARGLAHSSVGVPCPLRAATGVPCPLCGMTTSVTEAATGDLAAAFAVAPAGIVAVFAAIALLLVPRKEGVNLPRWALPGGLLLMWLWQLFRFGVL